MRPAGMSSDEDDLDDDFDYYFSSVRKAKKASSPSAKLSSSLQNVLDSVDKVSMFHEASASSNFDRMEELIANGVPVDESKISDWTPLMKACSNGNYEVVSFLLEKGADPNLHKELYTPLMACCIGGYESEENKVNCLRLLISHGAKVNATDRHHSTALIHAATNGMEQITTELLAVPGIQLDIQDKDGWSALFHAVCHHHKPIVEKLVTAGIQLDTVSRRDAFTAVELAEMKGFDDLVRIMRPCVDKPLEIPKTKWDPLQMFFSELPDEEGRGGFSSEVANVFASLRLEHVYNTIHEEISFPEFLVITEERLKSQVRLSPHRRKILRGTHKYHMASWRKSSLPPIKRDKILSIDDFVLFMSNVTKHLSVLYATLDYVKVHLPRCPREALTSTEMDLIRIFIDTHTEIEKLRRILVPFVASLEKIRSAGKVEADYIGPDSLQSKRRFQCLYLFMGVIVVTCALFHYKLR